MARKSYTEKDTALALSGKLAQTQYGKFYFDRPGTHVDQLGMILPACTITSKIHNAFGPAEVHADGTVVYRRKGQLHRSPGPAITHADGSEFYYFGNVLHNPFGPAIKWADGTQLWFDNGTCTRHSSAMGVLNHNMMNVITTPLGTFHFDRPGNWVDNITGQPDTSKLHRLDGPAAIWTHGTVEWYVTGQLHRDGDLPAFYGAEGQVMYFKNGRPHRDNDLPALIWPYGKQEWWVDGQRHRDVGPADIYPGRHSHRYILGNRV